ncbi:unnamed protein product [Paramecium sonneborni]|uniref:Uncharacterized protein n=1 Tax=Paramecium sonneborni TaxID=65129 RepID=A0A8S1LVN0_9CILI|nr:unnamed protein product [Paramecium sonneborni]
MRIFKQAFETIQGKKQQEENKSNPKDSFYIDQQFMTPEFLYQSNQNLASKNKNTLTQQFFITLANLEYLFHKSPIKQVNTLDKLVGMYQECIQQYDTLLDPIKYYFLYKIKNLIIQSEQSVQRESCSIQSINSSKKQPIQQIDIHVNQEFLDFTDRIEKPTEYATPKDEDQFQQEENLKIINQLQNLIDDSHPHKSTDQLNFKKNQLQSNSNEFYNHPIQNSQSKSTPNLLCSTQQITQEQLKLDDVETQLLTQSKSIQDRLLARQRNKQKKDN